CGLTIPAKRGVIEIVVIFRAAVEPDKICDGQERKPPRLGYRQVTPQHCVDEPESRCGSPNCQCKRQNGRSADDTFLVDLAPSESDIRGESIQPRQQPD